MILCDLAKPISAGLYIRLQSGQSLNDFSPLILGNRQAANGRGKLALRIDKISF